MKLQSYLKKLAKSYNTLPFYLTFFFTIIGYLLLLAEWIATKMLTLTRNLKQHFTVKRQHKKRKTTLSPRKKFFLALKKRRLRLKKWRKSLMLPFFTTFHLPKREKRKRLSPKLRYFLRGSFFSLIFIFLPLITLAFLQSLPNPHNLTDRQIPQTTKIYDRNGVLLHQIYATQNRTIIPLADVPKHLQEATLAIEDKNFYFHPGFDTISIIRAFFSDIRGKSFQGGSTITQQLIKSSMLTPEPNVIRKLKEVILAFWAERIYTKKQILEMYFNQVPYGGTAWGVEAAAQLYFAKHVKDLDLAESAVLAGITAAPTAYSPYADNQKLWKQRQKEVLNSMVEVGDITPQQEKKALAEDLHFQRQQIAEYAPHFVNYITDLLIKKYGLPIVEKGGLKVTTTLDVNIQQDAQKIVTEEVTNDAYLNLTNGAALVTDPRNGDLLAMVGGKEFSDPNGGNVNVTTSLRQPGSSIKVVTYSAALSQGYTAASILDDTPVVFPGIPPYAPVNYDGKFHGKVPLRIALANSFNIPAVRTLNQIGVPAMVSLAKAMGIKSWGEANQYGLAITLGGAEATMLDMATVYGTLANQGDKVEINPILKVTDANGEILEKKSVKSEHVLSAAVSFIMANILSDNQARSIEFGTNSPLNIPGHTVSVKTGTTDYKRDNWTIGYTNNYVVTVWTGNNDNSPMSPDLASGITGAAPIWNRIMTSLLTANPETPFSPPSTIAQSMCFGHIEYFVSGTEKDAPCFQSVPSQTIYSTRTDEIIKDRGKPFNWRQ